MILDYNRKPDATVDEKVQSLMESTQLALNDIARAQDTADVAKEDAQTSVALSQTARQAAADASDAAAKAKKAADDAAEAVEEIEGDVSGLTTRVAQAESDIETAEGNITSLTGRVADAEGDITTIEGNVSSLTGRVADAEGDITTIEGNVSSLTGRVADAEADISTAEGNISTLQSDVATAQGNISTIQGNITNLSGRVSAAESDITTVEGNITTLSGRVSDAEDEVEDVLKGLALAEDVVGTLNWITAHSKVTTDTVPDPDTTYYIKHLDGTFEVVTDTTGKNPAQEGWYVLDEALQNYVLSHLALTNEGLKVMKDGSEWKVLIGDDGVYILDPNNNPANQMTGDGNIIGYEDETHAEIDYHSLQLIARGETTPFFWVSDLRDKNDNYQATITETFTADGESTTFSVQLPVSAEVSATDSSHSSNTVTRNGRHYTFATTPSEGATVTIVYKTISETAKAYTLGQRGNGDVGAMSVAEGYFIIASGYVSHAEGYYTTASGNYSHAEGDRNTASGYASHAEGYNTTASDRYSHAEGDRNTASGYASHAEGGGNTASGEYSHAEGGYNTTASGYASHAEGYYTTASGEYSHAEGGYNTTASGECSHAEGYYTTASGEYSHTEGDHNTASGECSHAEGYHAIASGICSHAEGFFTAASGNYAHAQNGGTIAAKNHQTAIGKYNVEDTETTAAKQKAFIIGNGTDANNRSNAFTVDWSGNVDASGDITDGQGNVLSDKADTTDLDDCVLKATPYFELDTTATSGTDKEIYDALVTLGWDSDVIV